VSDLFGTIGRLERIPIPDAEVYYLHHLLLGRTHEAILNELITQTPWRQEKVILWAKQFQQPRLVAWYGDPGRNYSYSGIKLTPMPWTGLLQEIRESVETAAAASFNSVLLNYYRNNRDSMGYHSDDEPELGHRPVIASLSLGEERTFVMKHKTDKYAKPFRLRLASGSLLLMKGDTQTYWKHGIIKETRPRGARVNLTFRTILSLCN
jgi:alkylated DNA repair dioxygenase AlkB